MKNIGKDWVVITGASSGIGKHTAQAMLERGWNVIPCVRQLTQLAEWQQLGAHPVILDIAKPEQILSATTEIAKIAGNGTLHLVNNAGVVVAGPVEAVPLAQWREVFEVNFFGMIALTQALLPIIRRGKGRVVNLSSISGLLALPYLGPYCASKFAVEALSDSLRRELRQFAVKVILIEPGPIATPIWDKNFAKKESVYASFSPENQKLYQIGIKKFETLVAASAASGLPASAVSDVIMRALTANKPKARYLVGVKTMAMQVFMAKILPASWLDALIVSGLARP
jgi:short-subunit dehydrogenase